MLKNQQKIQKVDSSRPTNMKSVPSAAIIWLTYSYRTGGGMGWHGLIVPATEGKWYCCGISLIHSPKSPHIVLSNPEFSA